MNPNNNNINSKRKLNDEGDQQQESNKCSKLKVDDPQGNGSWVKDGYGEFKNVILSINASQEKEVALHFLAQFQELMANITNYVDLDEILGLVFDESIGVIKFLRSRSGEKPFDEPKETAFSSIQNLLGNKAIDSTLVVGHCLKLKDAINCTWKSTRESARLQTAALHCLVSLIENYGSFISAYDFDASDLYRTLLLSSEKTSIFQPSVRGEMLQLLGLIAYIFKDQVFRRDTRNQVMMYLMKCIKAQVESTQKQLEASILQGSIKGMDFFLRANGSEYSGQLGFLEEMLEKIINPKISITFDNSAGGSMKKVKRREFQRAVLTLIEHNGLLFKQHLYRKHQQWFEDLITWCKSNYKEDSDRAKSALLSFLRVICDVLLETEHEDDSATLRTSATNLILTELVRIFENTESDSPISEISVDSITLISSTISLDPYLKRVLDPQLFTKLEKCIAEIKKAERGPGYVEELSKDEADAILPNLTSDEFVDFREILSRVTEDKLGSLVTRLIQLLSENESLSRRHASNLVKAIISVWEEIQSNFELDFVYRTLCDLILLDEESIANSEYLCKWWMEAMNSKRRKVQDKAMLVEFLQLFGLSSNTTVRKIIWDTIAVINERLLEQDPGAFLMLRLLEEVVSLCAGFPTSIELMESFSRFFFTLATSIQQYHAELQDECLPGCHHYAGLLKTREVFENFVQNVQNCDNDLKDAGFSLSENIFKLIEKENPVPASLVYKFCLHPCLGNLHQKYLEAFAKHNIFSIVTAAIGKGNTEDDLMSKTTALSTYEAVALLTGRDFLRETLNEAYVRRLPVPTTKPAEVVRVIIDNWKSIKVTALNADSANKRIRNLQFEHDVAAFNVAVTTLVSIKAPEKLVVHLIFEDYEGNKVWEKIVDSELEIFFPIVNEVVDSELNDLGGGSQDRTVLGNEVAVISNRNQRWRQRFDGTKSTSDAGRFDFTGFGRSNSQSQDTGIVLTQAKAQSAKTGSFALQSHPSLERITRVIGYLKSLETNPTNTEIPLWMKIIQKKFTTPNVPVNVKLFLCAVVLNNQDIFKPYGNEFLKSIILVITTGSIRNHPTEYCSSLNLFERELIQMLLDWNITSEPTQPSSTELPPTEDLFNYCARKVLYKNKEVQRTNLEILTRITASWIKPKFSARSHESIMTLFDMDDKTFPLLVVIAILKGGVLPCDEMDLRTFIGSLGLFLSSSSMQYYELAAEALGLLLNVCHQIGVAHFSRTEQHVRRFFESEKERAQPFVMMLNAVALNYPVIVVSFKSEIEHLLKHKPEVNREATSLLEIAQRQETDEHLAILESQSQLAIKAEVDDDDMEL